MGTEISVRITSTIPIFCDSDATSCEVFVYLDNPPTTASTGVCSSIIKNVHWENHDDFVDSTDTTNVLPLIATEDDFQKADTYTIEIKFEEIYFPIGQVYTLPGDVNALYPIFAGYQLPPLEVG